MSLASLVLARDLAQWIHEEADIQPNTVSANLARVWGIKADALVGVIEGELGESVAASKAVLVSVQKESA